MAVPKRRTSKSKRDSRRANTGIDAPALSICPQCGEATMPHSACPSCGTYKGRDVVEGDED